MSTKAIQGDDLKRVLATMQAYRKVHEAEEAVKAAEGELDRAYVRMVKGKDIHELQELVTILDDLKGTFGESWDGNVIIRGAIEARIEAGSASSINNAAEKISNDTGESKEAVRHRIRSGKKEQEKLGVVRQPAPTPEPSNEIQENQVSDPWQDHQYMDWIQTATDEEIREHVADVLAGVELDE
ncbi:MAG: hypothetical protein CVU64_03155 [Deltaproteobacteria bacterium HGW-Deltaproteobacteria-21]|nr:MAG: hypothetical protein CVU64_03155 [Deltaproteobacteria bacterium HGW-Deltaproteobacteria-21]